jgi:hypothetical protein
MLPFLTLQIPEIGNMLCPMHLPVLLCAFFCGPLWAGAVGFITPLLRSLIFGMPPLFPTASAMALELLTYGLVIGLVFSLLGRRKSMIYPSLIVGMLAGRAVWGVAAAIFYGIGGKPFGLAIFFTEAFVNAVPGIILQLILVPLLYVTLRRPYERILTGY